MKAFENFIKTPTNKLKNLTPEQTKKWVTIIFIIVIAVVLIIVFRKVLTGLLSSIGLIDTPEEKQAKEAGKNASKTQIEMLKQKYTQTHPDMKTYLNFCDVIYNQLGAFSSIDDDEPGAIATIKTYIRNPLDYAIAEQQYGLRQNYAFGIPQGVKMGLTGLINNQFNSKNKAIVKTYLTSIGITV